MQDFRIDHFTLAELVKSDTAKARGIDNTPPADVEENLKRLMTCVLEPARIALGAPIIITSGYRCPKLNKVVGGVSNSQHVTGQAADLVCKKYEDKRRLFSILAQMDIDQLLYERNSAGVQWVHVSFVEHGKNRHMVRDNYIVK